MKFNFTLFVDDLNKIKYGFAILDVYRHTVFIFCLWNGRINITTPSEISITHINISDNIIENDITNINQSLSHGITTVREFEISITGINTLDDFENNTTINIDESVSNEITTVHESEINNSSMYVHIVYLIFIFKRYYTIYFLNVQYHIIPG